MEDSGTGGKKTTKTEIKQERLLYFLTGKSLTFSILSVAKGDLKVFKTAAKSLSTLLMPER